MMNPHMFESDAALPGKQQGVALAVALILLVVATMIGLAGIRQTALEEQMSGNLYDRSLAMQVAEAALRAAEAKVVDDPDIDSLGGVDCSGSASDDCSSIPDDDSDYWTDLSGTDDSDYLVNTSKSAGTPQYLVQYLGTVDTEENLSGSSANTSQYGSSLSGSTADVFRIFARNANPEDDDAEGRAIVRLASTYRCGSE